MSSSGTPSGASSPVPKIELGTAGAFRPGSAVGQTGQAPNGTLAGGAAGGVWATQGKGSMVSSPRSVPPVEAAKTRKKGLSVSIRTSLKVTPLVISYSNRCLIHCNVPVISCRYFM